MPVSQKPRRKKGETGGPSPYSVAGTLLYSFYEAGMRRKAQQVLTPEELMARSERRARGRRVRNRIHVALLGMLSKRRHHAAPGEVFYAPADVAGSRPAERRKRQGAHLHQHPSVVARFANHPTRAQIEEAAARIEAAPKPKRAPRKKKVEAA